MKVLAIETSLGETSLAVAIAGQRTAAKRLPRDRGQAERLMPQIKGLMDECGLSFAQLDRIAVCIGPGGFSSIRTGVAAARGLGLAAGKPVVGASGFRIMAHALGPQAQAYGLAIPGGVDAVFAQCFDASGHATTAIELLMLAEAGAWFAARVQTLGGPAAHAIAQRAAEAGLCLRPVMAGLAPDAVTLARIAPELDPGRDLPVPLYIRPADAKPQTGCAIPRRPESE